MREILTNNNKPDWKLYLEKRVVIMLALGFSSGLPILLVFGPLSFCLREAGVSRTDSFLSGSL